MLLYRSTFHLHSACASAWQADTLFGHLCWSLVRREGEDFLTELFLEEYRAGNPPVLLSDGFPSGYLPRPRVVVPRMSDVVPMSKVERITSYRDVKDRLKARWLSLDEFNRVCRGEAVAPVAEQPEQFERVVSKNQIDRLTDTAGGTGGKLYDFTEFCFPAVDVYWRIAPAYEALVREFLDDLQRTGYGKRKSVGYGDIASCSLAPFDGFSEVPHANGFVTLSNFVPDALDPTDGFWMTTVKYGKLGEDAATGRHPFKRPIIQLQASSCFYDASPREWYGRLVANVAVDPRVVQYAYAFPVPMALPPKQ
jgi:CRISPR-associated protein Csm4